MQGGATTAACIVLPYQNNLISLMVTFSSDYLPPCVLGDRCEESRIHPGVTGGFTKAIQICKFVEDKLIVMLE